MKVTSKEQAWAEVNKIFPTDYEKDEAASQRAGYDIYRHREFNYYNRVCDLGNRLEVLTGEYGENVTNIWIEPEETISDLETKLAAALKEIETLKARVKALRVPCGTRLSQDDYLKLEASGDEMTDAEAIVLINKEFGFEAARIEILHEAEVDITEEGSRYVKTEKAPRKPVYAATDWNYIRFNVRTAPATWYYEMINSEARAILL